MAIGTKMVATYTVTGPFIWPDPSLWEGIIGNWGSAFSVAVDVETGFNPPLIDSPVQSVLDVIPDGTDFVIRCVGVFEGPSAQLEAAWNINDAQAAYAAAAAYPSVILPLAGFGGANPVTFNLMELTLTGAGVFE